jgi:hypothetical protein
MNGRLSKTRRGVLLLLVLGILALFGLIAVAFVIISGQSQRSAKIMQRVDQTSNPPEKLLNEAMMQVARGPSNFVSVVGPHSLLEDMYGNTYIYAQITGVVAAAGGQLIEFTYQVSSDNTMNPPNWIADSNPQYRPGCVVTFLDPPFMGESTRIVGRNPTSGDLQLLATGPILAGSITANTRIIINGTPFSGTGFGFNPATGNLDLAFDATNGLTTTPSSTTWPAALLPNMPLTAYSSSLDPLIRNPQCNPPGGANEDYDAADYQNMLLAAQIPTAGINVTLPSLHRSALVRYWAYFIDPTNAKFSTADELALTAQNVLGINIKRTTILRPLPEDHPNFTGSNPTYKPGSALYRSGFNPLWDGQNFPNDFSWDVDNDGDGVPDSIWVDLGMPVRAAKDGKLYKPLFAILCEDMDGRLNLNAHGSLAQANTSNPYDPITNPINAGTSNRFASATATNPVLQAQLLRGQGYGPTEINLLPLIASNPASPTLEDYQNYQKILIGNGTVEGRYGSLDAGMPIPIPGKAGQNYLGFNKYFNLPDDFSDISTYPGTYGSSPDLRGTQTIGLDPRGQPLYQDPNTPPATSGQTVLLPDLAVPASTTNPYVGGKTNDPYELDLSRKAAHGLSGSSNPAPDNPFSVNELEQILRPFDRDATTLPDRLTKLAAYLIQMRHSVTTESHDLPCQVAPKVPNSWSATATITGDLNDPMLPQTVKDAISQWYPPRNLVDLLTVKYYNDYRTTGSPASAATVTNAKNAAYTNAPSLFPRELLLGLKMNVNRPLGNWGNPLTLYTQPGTTQIVPFNFDPSGNNPLIDPVTHTYVPDTTVPPYEQAKQIHARHLYVLMMLLRETGTVQYFTEPTPDELIARRIAQWAINAVDFMTPDSVMTPFEYDVTPLGLHLTDPAPYTGLPWRVDGNLVTDENLANPNSRGVVWGCKAPDLLLTETLAFHDRRVADTALDPGLHKRTDPVGSPPHPGDTSLDQPLIPQGSAFFELYCTRNDTNPQAPRDLYQYDSVQKKWNLDLGKLAPAWTTTTYNNKFGTTVIPDNLKLQYPIWRIVIGESNFQHADNDAVTRFNTNPDTFAPETEQIKGQSALPTSLLSTAPALPITIDRIVWFANLQPVRSATSPGSYHADADRVYYYHAGNTVLPGGNYMIIGPRWTTHIGAENLPAGISPSTPMGKPSPQKISLNSNWYKNNEDNVWYPDTNTQIKTPRAMIVAADPPTAWVNTTRTAPMGIGLSISEPIPALGNYYPEPTTSTAWDSEYDGAWQWYGPPDGTSPTFKKPDVAGDSLANRPLFDENLLGSGSTVHSNPAIPYKTIFLQRLANPSEPFEPTTNPYITVDWQPVDLTVFSGFDHMTQAAWDQIVLINSFGSVGNWDQVPSDTTKDNLNSEQNNPVPNFASRQRGDDGANILNNIWIPYPKLPLLPINPPPSTIDTDPAAANLVYKYNLNHTLGYINITYWNNLATWNPNWKTWDGTTPAPPWQNPSSQPWINNNTTNSLANYYGDPIKPYPWLAWNNRPYVSQLELMMVPSSDPSRMLKEYQLPTPPLTNAIPYEPTQGSDIPFFPSLLNFFESYPAASPNRADSFYRVLDYIYVPSRFVDAELQGDPALMGVGSGNHLFHPPFNLIPNYRESGRINLNTIYDERVFNGLRNYFPADWNKFVRSRRGDPLNASSDILASNSNYPTEFVNPFRSTRGASMVPLSNMQQLREIDATLLRSDPAATTQPLFQYQSTNEYDNPDRNPYFRYQGLERLGNLVTTRSNVYSVWITVGYFEVKPKRKNVAAGEMVDGIPDVAHPDGYELGQEMGSDTGEIVRHRAFYMIDRTIPVGFQRGQDLNVEKAIILKRFIE